MIHQPTLRAQSLPWQEPLALAEHIRDEHWMLLYSGTQATYSGRYSYLGCGLAQHVEADSFPVLEKALQTTGECFSPAWFGYLGYGLKDSLETLVREKPNWLDLPNSCLMRFHHVYVFDHDAHTLTLWSDGQSPLPEHSAPVAKSLPEVTGLRSTMSNSEYLKKAAHIIDRIHAGDLYQANLTRKFTGEFSSAPDAFLLFKKLCECSPAPYSAFMRMGNRAILSSSPERFLSVSADGKITARPIKGTAPRHADPVQDEQSRRQLAASEKDRAENLMIVDLMRNDLARCCEEGSVKAGALFEVTSHATIHHMASTVSGQKRSDCSTIEAVSQCFPPGSMTGAPKIKAMNLCAEMERLARGVYSGAIGWFGGDGSCDLSVVIRTLVLEGSRFEFQTGGGIVADSTPEGELEETFHKARGILRALGIDIEDFKTMIG